MGAADTSITGVELTVPGRPAGWPGAVTRPGTEQFVASAKAWLFDLGPAQWRTEPVLHRCPLLLARMVRIHLEIIVATARGNRRQLPRDFENLPQEILDELTDFCHQQELRAKGLAMQVRLLERAIKKVQGKPTSMA
ncbi:hypothetical protein AB0D12_38270 [Streptomyces sp. NPDC048479]|uniref:hypothetical protein n=1 Tax=Streptomyces sp. NPDC048479 TaxID=3154725 RepID=UPI00341C9F1B